MNRRKFIAKGAMSAALLSVFPSFALTENIPITLSDLGKGFKIVASKVKASSISSLSQEVRSTHQNLVKSLDELGYIYNKNSVVKLNSNSYMIPLSKKSFLGMETKELAFIVEANGKSEFYVLNEKISEEFDLLINNFNNNMQQHVIDIEASDFSFPVKVVKQMTGLESTFVYKNKFDNIITLHNYKSKTKALIN